MTVSTHRVVPEAPASGTAPYAEPHRHMLATLARSSDIGMQALARAARDDFPAWLGHVRAAAACAHPIRLAGTTTTFDAAGRIVSTVDLTSAMPDGVIYKACGNRRSTVCPACSKVYQRDAYHIVRAGIIGGKGIPDTVAQHPAIFATFTAPGFGTVHNRVVKKHSCEKRGRCDCRAEPCHARHDVPRCEHGNALFCFARHERGDNRIGKPVCMDCYDYDAHVVWNKFSTELWRRTKQAIDRELAKLCTSRGISPVLVGHNAKGEPIYKPAARARCGKAAEFQARAVVHFHALIRLDGRDPDDPDRIVPPPTGLTADDLDRAIARAARSIAFDTPEHRVSPAGWRISWGEQQHNRPITLSGDGEITDSYVAGYLAKYATKSTEITGHTSGRITDANVTLYIGEAERMPCEQLPRALTHPERLVEACWRLGRPQPTGPSRSRIFALPWLTFAAPTAGSVKRWHCPTCGNLSTSARCLVCLAPAYRQDREIQRFFLMLLLANAIEPEEDRPGPYEGLRRWAHMLGFGGHFFSQSQRYSVRFRVLREARITFRRTEITPPDGVEADQDDDGEATTLVINNLTLAGIGWHTTADAELAATSATLAREHQQLARQLIDTIAYQEGSSS